MRAARRAPDRLALDRLEPGSEQEKLKDVIRHAEEEARMVLPGIQALFGFQLIAVFNQGFRETLTASQQVIHLVALTCVALAATLVLAPAAYHRQAEPIGVSSRFVRIATWCLTYALVPLMLGTTLDLYLIAQAILHRPVASAALALAMFLVMAGLWFVLPQLARRRAPPD